MADHAPHQYGTYPAAGGIRCDCGWEDRTGRDYGMRKVWAAYRRHWLETLAYDRARRQLSEPHTDPPPAAVVNAPPLFVWPPP